MNLFPHNKEAYESAVRLFKQHSRVCIIRPTGTGKSVIIAAFVNQLPSKRHLLLAPGAHIFNEIQKHIQRGKISSSTYIGLKQKKALFKRDSFDYIYLDEFHRLGGEVWGGAVERLLKLNPKAKVLGTSATPIRYLDDCRNMASEIFNDCIATQMSLNSAIAKGILPAPVYVSALYSVREEFQHMKKKILSSGLVDKKKVMNDLDSKVIDWERSSGLDTVIIKHLHPERRRVIVFCKDWEHLKDARKILNPIFQTVYRHFESLSLYSKMKESENESALKLFSGEDQRAIILYTIDKVNEGLHTNNCNTVILLRDTISPIVFYQQIGRAFSIKVANRPLIIDLVNNFKNVQLASFKSDFEQELTTANSESLATKQEKVKAAIEFIDETLDIREVFSSFDEEIDVWSGFYEKGKAYFNTHGHLYVSPADAELRDWVRNQKKAYQRRKMGIKRAEQLRAIGLEFDREIPARWMATVWEIEEWKGKNGALPDIKEDSRLYTWMVRQRQGYRKGELSTEQITILRNLIRLDEDTTIRDRVDRLATHFKDDKAVLTKEIAHQLSLTRILHQKGRLPGTLLAQLRKANVPFEGTGKDYTWLEKMKRALSVCQKTGAAPAFKAPYYNFCIKERRYLEKKHPCANFMMINKEAKATYESFKAIISSMGAPDWHERYAKLKLFAKKHGRVTNAGCDENLLEWMWRQRRMIRDGKLPPEKLEKLLEIKEVDWHTTGKRKKHEISDQPYQPINPRR
ncbi:MAG TPA: Helicase associated domain protein [Puia sp.]|jgi:superfamily II DNA or RNA helicase|nr:Helicase associated domain protein [Puia sp.]